MRGRRITMLAKSSSIAARATAAWLAFAASAPAQILFVNPAFDVDSNFTMHYTGKVPATGSLTYRFVYSTAALHAQVHSDALAAQGALKTGRTAPMQAGAAPIRAPCDRSSTPSGLSKHGRL